MVQEKTDSGSRNKLVYFILFIAVALFFFVDYQFVGLRLFIGLLLLFVIPFYFMLDCFDLEEVEKVVFAFFVGIGIVPLVVFYFAKLVVSFRLAILVCFLVIVAIAFIMQKFVKKKDKLVHKV